jgi:hypothetical protein
LSFQSRSRPTRSSLIIRAFLVDQAKVAELRQRFEKYTGPVVNAGGVR